MLIVSELDNRIREGRAAKGTYPGIPLSLMVKMK